MSDDEKKQTQSNDSSIYYILGGVVLVAAVAGFFLLKPKTMQQPPVAPTTQTAADTTSQRPSEPEKITKLACGKQYYNPVVGFPKFYLSAEGVDVKTTGDVTCDFEISIKDNVVAKEKVTSPVTEARERGGATFRCQTPAVELARNVATDVKVTMTNADGEKIECKQAFLFQ